MVGTAAPDVLNTSAFSWSSLGSTCRSDYVQLGNAAVNLTDHALRERPEVEVQRHQHHDVPQRARIGPGHLDKGLPERLAGLRQGPHDLVYDVDAKPLAHVAIPRVTAALWATS